jgi:L,D-transpeptidase ErfK/SrfK
MLIRFFLTLTIALAFPIFTSAESFDLPVAGDSVIGGLEYVYSREDETLIDIAREFDLGYDQIVAANPNTNRWIPGEGTKVTLPHLYVLPNKVRKGIVLNIAELRLYYYPTSSKQGNGAVHTFPVSIGRMDWKTPLGTTRIVKKERNPIWRPTQSIKQEHALEGDVLPDQIAGGSPENPLGLFALRLGFPEYLIHGVDERKTYGIGMRVTHGCIRMYPDDIEKLFALVPLHTSVEIMNQPIKAGWLNNRLYLEVHQPLNEGEDDSAPDLPRIAVDQVLAYIRKEFGDNLAFEESLVIAITNEGNGIPQEIAIRTPQPGHAPYDSSVSTRTDKSPRNETDSEYQKAVERYLAPTEFNEAELSNPSLPEAQNALTAKEAVRRQSAPQLRLKDPNAQRSFEDRY